MPPVHTRTNSAGDWNPADEAFAKYREQFPRPKSYWSKVKNTVSKAFSSVAESFESLRDSSVARPFSFLATLGASTALATGVTKTVINALGNGLYNRSIQHLASGFTKEAFVANSYTGLWSLLIPISLYLAKNLYEHNTVYMPGRHVSASKLGLGIGCNMGIGSAILDAKSIIAGALFGNNWANRIMSGLGTYSFYKATKNSTDDVSKGVFGALGLFSGYHFIRTFTG